jgi:GNAT superfamily N-acetyltransferase
VEEGREECFQAVAVGRGLAAEYDGKLAGFLTIQPWYDSAHEITWMATHADLRGRGLGKALIGRLVDDARTSNRAVLLVTTLSESVPEPGVQDGYVQTRAFYRSCGFIPVWEPHGWWNDDHQAVLMIKPLGSLQERKD